MELEVITLCDSANISGGKLSLLGAFDIIYTKYLSKNMRPFTLALVFRVRENDIGDHEFNIEIENPDGTKLVEDLNGKFSIAGIEGATATVPFTLPFYNMDQMD